MKSNNNKDFDPKELQQEIIQEQEIILTSQQIKQTTIEQSTTIHSINKITSFQTTELTKIYTSIISTNQTKI